MSGRAATYRIVGVRADGSRAVLSVRLPLDDATWVRDTLIDAKIFADVMVELDDPESGNGERPAPPSR
jgi:hypothetical protein